MTKCSFALMCAYYYCTVMIRNAAYTVAALLLAYMIHKIVSWAIWVMSL